MCRRRFIAAILIWAVTAAAGSDENLYDPMRPAAPPAAAAPAPRVAHGFDLSAILYSPQRRVAVVNGAALSEGDRVGAARVAHIGRHAVELALGDDRVILRLGNPPQTQ